MTPLQAQCCVLSRLARSVLPWCSSRQNTAVECCNLAGLSGQVSCSAGHVLRSPAAASAMLAAVQDSYAGKFMELVVVGYIYCCSTEADELRHTWTLTSTPSES